MADSKTVSLKNSRGNGPRGVIDVKGNHHVMPVGGELKDIEVDEMTVTALNEAWEAGGDVEVTSGGGSHPQRAKLSTRAPSNET